MSSSGALLPFLLLLFTVAAGWAGQMGFTFPPPSAGITDTQPSCDLSTGDLNPSPLASAANTLPTGPSPHLPLSFFFLHSSSLRFTCSFLQMSKKGQETSKLTQNKKSIFIPSKETEKALCEAQDRYNDVRNRLMQMECFENWLQTSSEASAPLRNVWLSLMLRE